MQKFDYIVLPTNFPLEFEYDPKNAILGVYGDLYHASDPKSAKFFAHVINFL